MKWGITLGLFGALVSSTSVAHAQFGDGQPMSRDANDTRELVVPMDVVFCIDDSGSMQNYLEQTKGLLNSLVRGLKTPKDNVQVDLRVGLIRYGHRDDYDLVPMTRDVSSLLGQVQELQATEGGEEWVGDAISLVQQKMEWRPGDVLRMIYVMGNGDIITGSVSQQQSVLQAVSGGIAVNAVQCEPLDLMFTHSQQTLADPLSAAWREVAHLGKGDYFHFALQRDNALSLQEQIEFSRSSERDQQNLLREAHIDQWMNARIQTGLALLEQTHVPAEQSQRPFTSYAYKKMRAVNKSLGGIRPFAPIASNATEVALIGALSGRPDEDLVGLSRVPGFDVSALPDNVLPIEMRVMSIAERQNYLQNMGNQRQQIRQQLANLQSQRLLLKRG